LSIGACPRQEERTSRRTSRVAPFFASRNQFEM